MFADIAGSIGIFEALGNLKGTQAITRLTRWISGLCESHNGFVAKHLGDGVLVIFSNSEDAAIVAAEIQHVHSKRIENWPDLMKMRIQIGISRGELIEHDGDCYGDAVNVASRLCGLSGPGQILASEAVIENLPITSSVLYHPMGSVQIKGRTKPCVVHRIEWEDNMQAPAPMLHGGLDEHALAQQAFKPAFIKPAFISLSWLNTATGLDASARPLVLGCDAKADFVVQDRRVSRKHVRIEWRCNKLYLQNLSNHGTWLRFADSKAIVVLRQQECVLVQDGELALGASFNDFTVPTVAFRLRK